VDVWEQDAEENIGHPWAVARPALLACWVSLSVVLRSTYNLWNPVVDVCMHISCHQLQQSVTPHFRSRGSSVNIVSDYGLDDRGSIPDRDRGYFF
jgi:hypothetical protein